MVKLLKTTMVKYLHINEALNTESSFFRLKFSKFSATQTRMNTHFQQNSDSLLTKYFYSEWFASTSLLS